MTSTQATSIEIDSIINRVQGIKATIAGYDDAVAADAAMNDYIAKLELLKPYTDGSLELTEFDLHLLAEHERDAREIAQAKDTGQFKYATNTLDDLYGGFMDMTSDLPTLDSLPAYNEMLDEQDGITQSDREFENWRRL